MGNRHVAQASWDLPFELSKHDNPEGCDALRGLRSDSPPLPPVWSKQIKTLLTLPIANPWLGGCRSLQASLWLEQSTQRVRFLSGPPDKDSLVYRGAPPKRGADIWRHGRRECAAPTAKGADNEGNHAPYHSRIYSRATLMVACEVPKGTETDESMIIRGLNVIGVSHNDIYEYWSH